VNAFADLDATPAGHFALRVYALVADLLAATEARGGTELLTSAFPFLGGYVAELERRGLTGRDHAWGARAVAEWEMGVRAPLPLRDVGLDAESVLILLTVGLVEEDARFGALFDALQGLALGRPTWGWIDSWRRARGCPGTRGRLRALRDGGWLFSLNADAPQSAWTARVPAPIWNALRGEPDDFASVGLVWTPRDALPDLADLALPEKARAALARVPEALTSGEARTLVLRGPVRGGRTTALGAVARATGAGLLVGHGPEAGVLAPLSALLGAMPVRKLTLTPGETVPLAPLLGFDGLKGVILGPRGGITGPEVDSALVVDLPPPDPAERRTLWASGLREAGAECCPHDLDAIANAHRLARGHVRRAAGRAAAVARLDGRTVVTPEDATRATSALGRERLEGLATRVEPSRSGAEPLVLDAKARRAFDDLTRRCRRREQLAAVAGPALAARLRPGVKALFAGPSGSGKTLAARHLAATLGMDLYRADIAGLIDKHLGEFEKRCDALFGHAEALDVVLVLDEGDSVMARRTDVRSSNDRYANLETNFLLQRLEDYEGIIVVTTNAPERIDDAFRRRLDAVIEFRAPEARERWAIWRAHLPAAHAVSDEALELIAGRCPLSGGQIRNAALFAVLVALEAGEPIGEAHVTAAVRREYDQTGGVCPVLALPGI
jgi:hypothetical protein